MSLLKLRVQTREGLKQVALPPTATLAELTKKLATELALSLTDLELSTRPTPGETAQKLTDPSRTLADYKLRNGTTLVLMTPAKEEVKNGDNEAQTVQIDKTGKIVKVEEQKETPVVEDEVDQQLHKTDGWINRRDPRSRTAKPDDYIAPWTIQSHSPWKEQKIKHLPFHAWVKEQVYRSGSNTQPALVEDTFTIPKGENFTSKDLAGSTITINRQPYRHVDMVSFEHRSIVDTFIQGWRNTGLQRCGYLIGRYEPDETIPLAIACKVVGIYEPPQTSTRDTVLLLRDPTGDEIDELLSRLNLRRVGFIWTNLKTNDDKVLINDREPDAPLLPSELIRMAHLQARYPSPWAHSRTKKFGSKFVSVIVQASREDNGVETEAYMLSNQGVALITEGIIKGNKTDPKNFRVVRSKPDSKVIFPDLLYSDKDEYNNRIIKKAHPTLPSTYFLIGVRHGFAVDTSPFFKTFTFPPTNRPDRMPTWQNVREVYESRVSLQTSLQDFHLLIFVAVIEPTPALANVIIDLLNGKTLEDSQLRSALKTVLDEKFPPKSKAASPTKGDYDPQEAALRTELMSMGFSDEQIREALFVTGGKGGAEAAVNYLLSK